MVGLSGYQVELEGRTVSLTQPSMGLRSMVLPDEETAERVALACSLDSVMARATWWHFHRPSAETSAAVKRAAAGWRVRVVLSLIVAARLAARDHGSVRVNMASRSAEDWRADVLAVDAGAEFGRSACGRFEIAFTRSR